MSDLRTAAQNVVIVWKRFGTAESLRGWMEILEASLNQPTSITLKEAEMHGNPHGHGNRAPVDSVMLELERQKSFEMELERQKRFEMSSSQKLTYVPNDIYRKEHMTKEKAWQKYQQEIMPTRRNYVYPLEGAFYKTWSRAWDEAVNAEREACAVDAEWCIQNHLEHLMPERIRARGKA